MKKLLGGISLALLTMAGAASAQTTTGTSTTGTGTSTATSTPTTTPMVPGAPDTGVGGDALMSTLILASLLGIALLSALYLYARNRNRMASQWE